MAQWNTSYPVQTVGVPGQIISDHKPGEMIAKVLQEIQRRVPNAVRADGDAYITVRATIEGNDLVISVELQNPPVSLPSGGEAGQVLTRTTGNLESGDGAQWDWIRAVDL